jgi:hypothetical protein
MNSRSSTNYSKFMICWMSSIKGKVLVNLEGYTKSMHAGCQLQEVKNQGVQRDNYFETLQTPHLHIQASGKVS